jgi:hypothetical protein
VKNFFLYNKTTYDAPVSIFQSIYQKTSFLQSWLCDGIETDRYENDPTENETLCQQHCSGGGYFNTDTTQQCIHWSMLCNKQSDATDGWDEEPKNCLSVCTNIPELEGHMVNVPVAQPQCLRKVSQSE